MMECRHSSKLGMLMSILHVLLVAQVREIRRAITMGMAFYELINTQDIGESALSAEKAVVM